MLHISRIFAIYLGLFLIFIGYFTLYPPIISVFFVPIAFAMIVIFWKIKFLRYLAIAVFVFCLAATRVTSTQSILEIKSSNNSDWVMINEPTVSGKSQRFIIQTTQNKQRINIEVTTNQSPKYEFGEVLRIDGTFDNQSLSNSQISKNIAAKIFYPKIIKKGSSSSTYISLRKCLISVKNFFKNQIMGAFPEPHAGLINGILLGERSEISDELSNALSRTGTMHIIALSGFNITIVAVFLTFLTQGLSRKISMFLTISGIFCFILATGFSASAIRAGVMGVLLVLAKFLGRKSDGLVAILFAAAIMVFANPKILLYDIGFQLSFAAACGIIFLVPILDEKVFFVKRPLQAIINPTIAAIIFTWPLTSYYFGVFSVVALFTNILILSFVEILMLLGFLTAIFGIFSEIIQKFFAIISWGVSSYIFKIIEFFSKPLWAVIQIKISSAVFIAGYYLLLFDGILFFRRKIGKPKTI